ncbi:venom metalloproteinase 3-like [Trichogramma pretiosum]|uniref:venom metalloproteinase 3-like n=1 Tax=Trichogramma pretiosum TaxID=7493 RepID=UPI000C71C9D0|nr:venom metalloproteinase 3-like [Trichogramma pretiosum]
MSRIFKLFFVCISIISIQGQELPKCGTKEEQMELNEIYNEIDKVDDAYTSYSQQGSMDNEREFFNYTTYLNEPMLDRVLLGSNSMLYIARSNGYGGITYDNYLYPQPKTKTPNNNQFSNDYGQSNLGGDVVYPQILAILDYDNYEAYGKDVHKITQSIAGLFNNVDIRFRTLKSPQVRLNLAGLVIPMDRDAVPYLTYNLKDDLEASKPFDAMRQAGEYFLNRYGVYGIRRDSYDIVVLLTNKDMKDAYGWAYVGQACSETLSVAIMTHKAKGENDYWIAAGTAHELGHLFGAYHDGDETAESCDSSAGHVMSGNRGKNAFTWSECSIRDMRNFFRSPSSGCLRNIPFVGRPYPRVLRGSFTTRDEQCKVHNGYGNLNYVASVNENNRHEQCYMQPCSWIGSDNYVSNRDMPLPPLDGTSCGDNMMCFAGQCVVDRE